MSRSVEELLRQGLDRATADAEVPATLLRRARHHNRRRREAIAGALAAGGAAIAAAATFAATAAPGVSANARHGQTINYVTTRAERALAHTSQGRAVEYDTRTITNSSFGVTVVNLAFNGTTGSTAQEPTVLSDLHASRLVAWTYRDLQLQQGYTASGKLVFSATIGPVNTRQGKQVYEAYGAAYPDRIQWHTPLTGGPNFSDPLNCANSGFDFPNWQQGITKALSCHIFTLAGNQKINGIDTIKLVRKPQYGIGETLWVDPDQLPSGADHHHFPAGTQAPGRPDRQFPLAAADHRQPRRPARGRGSAVPSRVRSSRCPARMCRCPELAPAP